MTDTVAAPAPDTDTESGSSASFRVVHRTIMRPDQELDIRPLYVGGVSGFASTGTGSEDDTPGDDPGDDTSYADA